MEHKKIHIFALAAHGQGISGSDRIFIEISRILSENLEVEIHLWEEGLTMCQKHGIDKANIKFQVSGMQPWKKLGFFINYLARIAEGIKLGLTAKIENNQNTIVYSASEFWMDCLPGYILKKRFAQIKWVAAWFQTAPDPLTGFAEGTRKERYRLSAMLYWLVQLPMKPLIEKNADLILVNNEAEKKRFRNLKITQKIMVFLGALDLEKIGGFRKKFKNIKKEYHAVFQGRFHPQKGVLELIDIWKKVVDVKPYARLAMIGDGPLMGATKEKIKKLSLEKNISLFGYLFDGPAKYKIFSQSCIVVHPAFYDSGGMASAEAMAFGLPAVGFNLKAYHSYYPKGMVKVEVGNLDLFADKIINLLDDKKLYKNVACGALTMIQLNWSFRTRTKELLKEIN